MTYTPFSAIFTFQSGYIQIRVGYNRNIIPRYLYIPIWLYSNYCRDTVRLSILSFTFQSGYIQIYISKHISVYFNMLYIPIWLYSNPYPIIPSIQAILNHIFCLPIHLQVQNDYLVYSLLLLIILLPLFYNNCRTLYIL